MNLKGIDMLGGIGKPRIVCLVDSTKFLGTYLAVAFEEECRGNIVLTINANFKDRQLFSGHSDREFQEIKKRIEKLLLWKVIMADEILVLNVGNYVGAGTKEAVRCAKAIGKPIRWLEPRPSFIKRVIKKIRGK